MFTIAKIGKRILTTNPEAYGFRIFLYVEKHGG